MKEGANQVNIDQFWLDVEQAMVTGKDSSSKIYLNSIAPHISSFTRFSANFFHEERDRTFPDVTPSQLQQMQDAFHAAQGDGARVVALQQVLEACDSRSDFQGVLELLKRLKLPYLSKVHNTAQASNLLQTLWGSEYSCFYKLFARKQGKSGGICDGTCPHGVQYYQKFLFLAETPLDTVAALAQFKHLPTIAFFDAWCCVEPGLRKVLAKRGVVLDDRNGGVVPLQEIPRKPGRCRNL